MRYSANTKPPKLDASCTTPALALSATTLPRGGALKYTAVGPERTVVIAVDAARLSADLVATPLPGAAETQVVKVPMRLAGCKATGTIGVQVPAGDHTVSVFPAEGGEPLASRSLKVTSR